MITENGIGVKPLSVKPADASMMSGSSSTIPPKSARAEPNGVWSGLRPTRVRTFQVGGEGLGVRVGDDLGQGSPGENSFTVLHADK